MSYPEVAKQEKISVGQAFKLIAEGQKIALSWISQKKKEEDYMIAMEQLDYLITLALPNAEEGSSKHLTVLLKIRECKNRIQGLEKIEINTTTTLAAPQVLERVKLVAGHVISPLVAEKLPQLQIAA